MFMTSATPPSVFFVLSLGALSGGVVKGVTGFGNAIINLLVWVAFTAAGVDSGPLQLAVLADSFGCVVCSIPLLVMTAAHKTADWRLVIAILVFTSAGSPLGAVLLTHLPVRWVELAMGCVLLLVICLQVRVHDALRKWLKRSPSSSGADAADGHQDSDGARQGASLAPFDSLPSGERSSESSRPGRGGAPPPALPPVLLAGADDAPRRGSEPPAGPVEYDDGAADPTAAAAQATDEKGAAVTILIECRIGAEDFSRAADGPPATQVLSPSLEPSSSASAQGTAQPAPHGLNCGLENKGDLEDGSTQCPVDMADTEPLLKRGQLASDAIAPAAATAVARRPAGGPGAVAVERVRGKVAGTSCKGGPIGARLRRWLEQQDWGEVRRISLVGSVAGFTSGVMGGMTGIGGPPLMFMYERLKVPKEVVRGTNAVNNVLQARLVSYIVMGVFKREDMALYGITSVAGLLGVIAGNGLAGRLDQRGFSRVLVALMIVCCALLFASAAGLKGHAAT